ncbi:unnamed protein product [Closterium sp. Yama58-4]|nr:unnamed protein product [Closterium sp. Yama58-4]
MGEPVDTSSVQAFKPFRYVPYRNVPLVVTDPDYNSLMDEKVDFTPATMTLALLHAESTVEPKLNTRLVPAETVSRRIEDGEKFCMPPMINLCGGVVIAVPIITTTEELPGRHCSLLLVAHANDLRELASENRTVVFHVDPKARLRFHDVVFNTVHEWIMSTARAQALSSLGGAGFERPKESDIDERLERWKNVVRLDSGNLRDTAPVTGLRVAEVYKTFLAHMEAVVAQPSSYEFKLMGRKELKPFRQQIAQYIEGIALGQKFEGALLQQGTAASVEGWQGEAEGGRAEGGKGKPKEASEGSRGKQKEVSEGDEWKKEKRKLKEKLDEERSEKEHLREELRSKDAELAEEKEKGTKYVGHAKQVLDKAAEVSTNAAATLDRSRAMQETLAKGVEQLVGDHAKAAAKTEETVKSVETSFAGVGDKVKTAAEGAVAGLGQQDVLVEAVKGVVNKRLEEIKASIVALVDKRVREVVAESTKGLKADIVSMVRDTTRQAFGEAGFAALPSVFGAATALARQGGGGGAGGKHPRGDDGSDTHGGMAGDTVHSELARQKRSKAGWLEKGVGDVPSKLASRAEGGVAPLHIDLTLGTPVGRADGRANIGASLPSQGLVAVGASRGHGAQPPSGGGIVLGLPTRTLAGRGGVEQTGAEGAVQGAAPRTQEVPGAPQGDVHDFLAGMRTAMETGQQQHPVVDQGLAAIRAGLQELQPAGDHHAHAQPQRPVASTPAADDDVPASEAIPPEGQLSFPPDLFGIDLGEADTYAQEWQAGHGDSDGEAEEHVDNEENEEKEDTEGLHVLGAVEGEETDGKAGGALAEVEGGRGRKGAGVRKDRNSPGWTADVVGGGRSRYLGYSLKRADVEFTVSVAMIVWDGYVSKVLWAYKEGETPPSWPQEWALAKRLPKGLWTCMWSRTICGDKDRCGFLADVFGFLLVRMFRSYACTPSLTCLPTSRRLTKFFTHVSAYQSGGLDFQPAVSLAVGAIAANAEARDMKAAIAYGVTIASTVAAAWYLASQRAPQFAQACQWAVDVGTKLDQANDFPNLSDKLKKVMEAVMHAVKLADEEEGALANGTTFVNQVTTQALTAANMSQDPWGKFIASELLHTLAYWADCPDGRDSMQAVGMVVPLSEVMTKLTVYRNKRSYRFNKWEIPGSAPTRTRARGGRAGQQQGGGRVGQQH